MKKVMKWLDEHDIEYILSIEGKKKCITIILKANCIWMNSLGNPMKYDKKIRILYDKYSGYGVYEQYGYSLTKTLTSCKKADMIIEVLKERFGAR